MRVGKVYLIGAGPSDVGLMTVRGKQLIEQADVIVYDRLIGNSMVLLLPERAEKIDVGKCAGNHTMPQEQINRLLLERAQEGKIVVRLKGGDPFLFGRGGEELELLVQHGIPYEIVPGVTSAIAVPAYAGIPVTHRDAASSVHIITGHRRAGQEYDIDFGALVRTRGTLVFLMGAAALADICGGLLAAGMNPDTPAAVVQQGTSARQTCISATVSTLDAVVRQQGVRTPAIIVVGDVCRYAEEFAWAEKRPLFGARIAVTRPKARGSALSHKLRALGAEVWELPTIRTCTITPNPALDDAMEHLSDYDFLVFTSPGGVAAFYDAMMQKNYDIRRFGEGKIAAIGQGTVKELRRRGVIADIVPTIYDGQHLGQAVGENCKNGDRILIPRASNGNQELVREIGRWKTVHITDIPVYDTGYEQPFGVDLDKVVSEEALDMMVFTSASTVHGFAKLVSGEKRRLLPAICIGQQTAAAAAEYGMQTVVAESATLDALAQTAAEFYQKKK